VEQGREVFAIPGALSNLQAKGCHALIKTGAKLVEIPEDVAEELRLHLPVIWTREPTEKSVKNPTTPSPPQPPAAQSPLFENDAEYAVLLKYMDATATSVDKLVDTSGLTAEAISSMLLILELQGAVKSVPGGLYMRIK